jgi:hypothetical protein
MMLGVQGFRCGSNSVGSLEIISYTSNIQPSGSTVINRTSLFFNVSVTILAELGFTAVCLAASPKPLYHSVPMRSKR